MRIISGKHKKRVIRPPKGMKERPTTDRAKEGLFNILENRFELDELRVLDLFAGTGSISYEFCSRSEARVTAVEKDHRLSRFIVRTAMDLGMKRLNVVNEDALRFLDKTPASYRLIFADPPYQETDIYKGILQRVRENGMLDKDGWLILEHDAGISFEKEEGFRECRKFGHSRFSIFVY